MGGGGGSLLTEFEVVRVVVGQSVSANTSVKVSHCAAVCRREIHVHPSAGGRERERERELPARATHSQRSSFHTNKTVAHTHTHARTHARTVLGLGCRMLSSPGVSLGG